MAFTRSLRVLTLLLALVRGGAVAAQGAAELPGVVIHEIMYHPASEDVREEFVELHNTRTTAVDLGDWRFSTGIQFQFPPETILPPGGFLVVVADPATFALRHPGVTNHLGPWTGRLSNQRETIKLEDAAGVLVDRVNYADEGDWADRVQGELDRGHYGWQWATESDGGGRSLELIHPGLSNDHGQNWAASMIDGGTPGRANSVWAEDVPPMILDVAHIPVVPTSDDLVAVIARVVDEMPAVSRVTLHWRLDGTNSPPFEAVAMVDQGLHEDGGAGDGVFGAFIPPQANHSVVEFYLEAQDATGQSRMWPAAAREIDGTWAQRANLLYQVDDAPATGLQPLYKLILTEVERAELARIGRTYPDALSNAEMNGTFISRDGSGTELRYRVGVRNRGHGTRYQSTGRPNNYRVNVPADHDWKGVVAINLNGAYTYLQHFGAVLSLKSGLAGAESRPVQVRVNNVNLGNNGPQTYGTTYVANEVLNRDFADHRFPLDGSGNLYRAMRDLPPSGFDYRGEDPGAYTNTWFKSTNTSEDDWSDLISMLRVIGTNDLFEAASVREVIDVDQWLRYLAIMALFANRETSPNTGHNDDYYLYAGTVDRRFRLLYYDLDTILGEGDASGSTTNSMFGSRAIPAFDRLFAEPAFLERYYQIVRELLDTTFAQAPFDALLDQTLEDYVPTAVLERMKLWMNGRRAYVEGLLPPELPPYLPPPRASVVNVPRSPTPSVEARLTVGGTAITHYQYALNEGEYSTEQPITTSIELFDLAEGTNRVRVLGRNDNGIWQREPTRVSWVVERSWPAVRLNEVLARNDRTLLHGGKYPDLIELFNEGLAPVDLSGLGLTDDPDAPGKYRFPAGTSLAAGAHLVLYANNPDGSPGHHTGFGLDQDGEGVYLHHSVERGGALLDAVVFGPQLPDYSIGRLDQGEWVLTVPTFGAANVTQAMGDPGRLQLNEWLTAGRVLEGDDFVELYNPTELPIHLGLLFLTDNLPSVPWRHAVAPHSYIAARGYRVFLADGAPEQGARHLNFKLAHEQGEIGLFSPDLTLIDAIVYGPQISDVSQGRTPDGSEAVAEFVRPTPGAPNPDLSFNVSMEAQSLLAFTNVWRYYQDGELTGTGWETPEFDDRAWPVGAALLYAEDDPLPAPANTPLDLGRPTYYFRSTFTLDEAPEALGLRATFIIDDGAAVYLNGTEVYRLRLPASGFIDYQAFASPAVTQATREGPFPLPAAALRRGENTVAVQVHQASATSTDVVFGLSLEALRYQPSLSALPVVIHEILARNHSLPNAEGTRTDWVELANLGTNAFQLDGMSVTDDPAVPRQWVFPPGTTLGPGAFLVLTCDDAQPASAVNTGFALAADGDALFLFDHPDRGGALVDAVGFGRQAADYSIGRAPAGGDSWILTLPTPGARNVPATAADPGAVRINEWMANPASGADWFELYNAAVQPVAMDGCQLSDDLADRTRSPIPPLSFIGTGADAWALFIADGDPGTGGNHVQFQLSAQGESIGLFRANGTRIDSVSFGPQSVGVSEGRWPNGAARVLAFEGSSSPGEENYLPLPEVVLNEILAHTDPPYEDAVELHNRSTLPIDVSGWFLSDHPGALRKYRIPGGTILPPLGYLVLYEYQFGAPDLVTGFTLDSAHGGRLCLSAADDQGQLTGFAERLDFGATANGEALGRHVTRAGAELAPMSQPTFGVEPVGSVDQFRTGPGAPNAHPRVGPLLISEIHYQPTGPGGTEPSGDEYLELLNHTDQPLPLYDPAAPTNTWRVRGGISFDLPADQVLPAGGYALLVSFHPTAEPAALAAFRNRFSVPSSVPVYGPFAGRLNNSGDAIILLRPDPPQRPTAPDAGFVPYIVVERVEYSADWPWPTNASGSGWSLQRIDPLQYGNDPAYWHATIPTAGSPNSNRPADTDADGLPDYWEWAHFAGSPIDGSADSDLDRLSDGDEYRAGTDPLNAASGLTATVRSGPGGDREIWFTAVAGRAYTVEYRDSLADPTWRVLERVEPLRVTRPVAVSDSGIRSSRFYRVALNF